MSTTKSRGVLQICVDCDLNPEERTLPTLQRLMDLTEKLVGVFKENQVPATWAVPDQCLDAFLGRVALPNDSELAMTADATWCSSELPKSQLEHAMRHRLDLFRSRDVSVTTLALRDTELGMNLDVLPRAGIEVVRQPVSAWSGDAQRPAAPLRYGVVQVYPDAKIPGRPGLLVRWDDAYSAKRSLWKAISQGQSQHVVIDLGSLAARPNNHLRRVENWLRMVVRLRAAGRLQVECLRDVVRRRCPISKQHTSRSILRPAA